ncbi:MAG: hypothetical protein H6Q41_745 [Deltaproteobacteria bacterium]|nr:hypothetical protein [Deltaproteobacteria bacterium]
MTYVILNLPYFDFRKDSYEAQSKRMELTIGTMIRYLRSSFSNSRDFLIKEKL